MSPSELADIFDQWAADADEQFRRAFDDDEIGKAARLRGKAQGLSLAAAELRRSVESDLILGGTIRTALAGHRREIGPDGYGEFI